MPGCVEEELRGYLECGLLCLGFGRALCSGCNAGFVVAFSCKGRGVCPSRDHGLGCHRCCRHAECRLLVESPADWGELVQLNDDRDVFQTSHAELPVIDIHSL